LQGLSIALQKSGEIACEKRGSRRLLVESSIGQCNSLSLVGKGDCYGRDGKAGFIQKHSQSYPVRLLCREMAKKLRAEGFNLTRYKTMKVMAKLKLQAKQRVAYKITTKRKHSDSVAANLLNQNFNPAGQNQIWAGDITYLKTVEGLAFHSDRGSQYTSKAYGKLLVDYGIRASMGDVGACWDNAVVERFFGSLKHDWIFKLHQPTREHMINDVIAYVKYYNLDRLHSSNNDLSPDQYEKLAN
jgi:putative transposase